MYGSSVFFNDTATTEIYTLSLHDALPISRTCDGRRGPAVDGRLRGDPDGFLVPGARGGGRRTVLHPRPDAPQLQLVSEDRKSTRLNSSHANISYAVFCLKKNKNHHFSTTT